MAVLHSKELFGWYLITLKLQQTAESRLPKKSTYGGEIVPDYERRPPESDWVISIKKNLEQVRQDNVLGSWAKLSIYRFPCNLMDGNNKDWVPQIVSLGPYHHDEERLSRMERHKWRCLHRVLERSHQAVGRYLDSVKKVERRARACYEGTTSMSSDKFVEMMVLDGCFVIELFQGFAGGFEKLGYPPNDPVFSRRPFLFEIQRDMIMLENQIPLFILDRLLGLQLGDPNQKGGVANLAIQFFDHLAPKQRDVPWYISKRLEFDPLSDHGRVHCLEVYWRSLAFVGPRLSRTKQWSKSRERFSPGVTRLREGGIKIEPYFETSWGNIRFKDGILEIPCLEIHEGTRSLFLNLIALEQSHFDCSNFVTSYVIFMHSLISSPEDVRYLRNHRIIEHCLGSDDEVVDLFKRLCQDVPFRIDDSYLCALFNDMWHYWQFGSTDSDPSASTTAISIIKVIYQYCVSYLARKRRAWIAILKTKYFDNPWSIISVLAAFVLLVLTFVQAVYAVYGYYRVGS